MQEGLVSQFYRRKAKISNTLSKESRREKLRAKVENTVTSTAWEGIVGGLGLISGIVFAIDTYLPQTLDPFEYALCLIFTLDSIGYFILYGWSGIRCLMLISVLPTLAGIIGSG